MAKPRTTPAMKSLFPHLDKIARDQITAIMEERYGNLSLREYLEKYWDWFAPWRSPFSSDKEISVRM